MERQKYEELFDSLKGTLEGIGLETYMLPGIGGIQIGDTLRTLVPVTDQGDAVMMELSLAHLSDELCFMQFYTTLIMEVGAGYDQLKLAVEGINFYCPIGAFGIFETQLYHKYGLLMNQDEDAEQLAADSMTALQVIYDILETYFPVATSISEGELTVEQAMEQGLLKGE